jgi:hypothetical protein
MSDPIKTAALGDEVREAFKSGAVFEKSDEKLDIYLSWIASQPVSNQDIRHAQIVRGITINTIKTDRHIKKVDHYIRKAGQQSTFHTYVILGLTVLAVSVSIWAVQLSSKQSHEAAKQIDRLITLQAQQVQLLKEQGQ